MAPSEHDVCSPGDVALKEDTQSDDVGVVQSQSSNVITEPLPRSALGKVIKAQASTGGSLDQQAESRNQRALTWLLVLMISNTAVQFTMAILGGSLAILGDAICAVVDCFTYVANLLAEKYARDQKWMPHAAAVLSMLLLLGVCVFVIVEAEVRINDSDDSDDVDAEFMLGGGAYNLFADCIGFYLLSQSGGMRDGQGTEKGRKHNMRSAAIHVAADALRAVSVIVVAIIGLSSDANLTKLDAWIALVISVTIILASGWELIRAIYSWCNLPAVTSDAPSHSHHTSSQGIETNPVAVTASANTDSNKDNELRA